MNTSGQDALAEALDADGFAVAGLAVLTARDPREAARALLRGLAGCGRPARAVVWTDHGELLFEPADASTEAHRQAAIAAFSGQPLTTPEAPDVRLLPPGAADAGALVLADPGALAGLEPSPHRLLQLAGQRLAELFSMQRLQDAVKELEQAEQLQHALFAIADLAASDRDMQGMLRGLHQIIGRLMYAENFYIALYDPRRETLRFIYFEDEMDAGMYDPDEEIPVAQMRGSLTLGLIRRLQVGS